MRCKRTGAWAASENADVHRDLRGVERPTDDAHGGESDPESAHRPVLAGLHIVSDIVRGYAV